MNLRKPVTDRDLLIHLGRAFVLALALTLLVVSGIVYSEMSYNGPRVVETAGCH
jgi:hypothetical protein